MFGRRLSANLICILSAILALVCGLVTYNAFEQGIRVAGIIAGFLTSWFTIDAIRSFFWSKSEKQ